jgi:hypothetical protein
LVAAATVVGTAVDWPEVRPMAAQIPTTTNAITDTPAQINKRLRRAGISL